MFEQVGLVIGLDQQVTPRTRTSATRQSRTSATQKRTSGVTPPAATPGSMTLARCLPATALAQIGRPDQGEWRSSVGPLGVERELVGVVEEYGEP